MNARFSAYHSVSHCILHTPQYEKGGIFYVTSNALTKTGRNPCINHATASSAMDSPSLGLIICTMKSVTARGV